MKNNLSVKDRQSEQFITPADFKSMSSIYDRESRVVYQDVLTEQQLFTAMEPSIVHESPNESPQIIIKHPELADDDEGPTRTVRYRKNISIVNQNGIDVDDVFGFGKRAGQEQSKFSKRISISKRITRMLGVSIVEDFDGDSLFENVPQYLAFLILGSSVILNTMIIPLFISIPEITWSRNGWRFLFQALILVPFVLHEKRTGNEAVLKGYRWSSAFASENIRQLFLSSINTSLQTTIFIVLSQYNYIANNCLLASMTNFWLSVTRNLNNEKCHKIEFSGQMMCLVGIAIITFDCYTLTADDLPANLLTKYMFNDHYFIDPWQKVVLGIIVPIVVAIVTTQISLYTQDLKDVYPPFLQLFLISIFTALNLNSVGYFMYCTTVNTTHFTGWFGFIVDGAFSKFMYIAIVFNFGIFFTQVLISKLYDPIIPAATALLEPPFTAFFLDVFGQQYMPSSFSGLGYILIIPGQFVIIFGQYLLVQKQPVLPPPSNKGSSNRSLQFISMKRQRSNRKTINQDLIKHDSKRLI